MSVVLRLMGFTLILLLLFAGGFAVGRAVGPVGVDASPPTGGPTSSTAVHSGAHP